MKPSVIPVYGLFHRNEGLELGLTEFLQGVSGALEPSESFSATAFREAEFKQELALSVSICSFAANTYGYITG